MRNAAAIVLVGCFALASALVAKGEPDTGRRAASDFHRLATIEMAPLESGAAYAVSLEADVIQALREGGELRVFDAEGTEVPSLVHTAVAREQVVSRPVEILDQTWVPSESGVVQTLTTRLTDRKTDAVNEFEFEIDEDRYNANVRVEAGENGEWSTLRDGLYLIRHAVPGEAVRYSHDTLRVPTARFREYRFTLTLPGRDRPLDVKKVTVREVVARGTSTNLPVHLERWLNERDPDTRHEYWKLDLAHDGLGVDRIHLTLDATRYARGASLSEWNEKLARPGRRLAHTVVFHYGDARQTDLRDFTTDARVLVLMLDQGDDAPVSLTQASAARPRQQVRFLAAGGLQPPLALYLEPDHPRTPRYDLPRTLREREIASFLPLEHAAVTANPSYAEAPAPVSERIPYLLYGVVGLLVIGLGAYIARTVKTGLPSSSGPG